MNPKVSVIIPCYNYGQYIDEALDSVLAQTFEDFEIIIVNDGSTDQDTIDKLENYNKPKTSVIHTENQGLPNARNNGIVKSTGQYICCLDADDKYKPEYLEKCVNILEKDTSNKVAIVTTDIEAFGERNEVWEMNEYDPIRLMADNSGGVHVASMFRKSAWEEVGGYPTNLTKGGYEDRSFWISIVAKGYRWEYIKEPLFMYRIKKNSMIHDAIQRHDELYSKVIENNLDFYKDNMEAVILYLRNSNLGLRQKINELYEILDRNSKQYAKLEKDHLNLTSKGKRNLLKRIVRRI